MSLFFWFGYAIRNYDSLRLKSFLSLFVYAYAAIALYFVISFYAFECNKCKYCLSLFPNGYNMEKGQINNENNVALMLNLLSPPSDIETITLCFELILHETNNRGTNYAQFLCESFWGWQHPHIKSKLKDLNTLTLEAIITVIDVFDQNGISINDKYITYDYENKNQCAQTKITKGLLGKYVWKITDTETINRIKSADEGNVFISKVFELFNLKFVIEFYPISMKTEQQTDDISALYISMLSMPKNVHSISFGYKLCLQETGTQDSSFVQFHDTSISIGWSRQIAPDTDIVKQMNQYTFEVELTLLDIYDKNGNLIMDEFVDINEYKDIHIGKEIDVALGEYEWVISDAQMIKKMRKSNHSQFFRSELFCIQGFKFFMQCTPNGANPNDVGNFGCFLYIASLPPEIWKITLYYQLLLVETNTIDCYATAASHKRTTCGWFRNLRFEDITNMDKFTFSLKIGIIDIFDKNGAYATLDSDLQEKICSNLKLTPCDKYVWKIRNKQLVKNIKCAKHMEYFDSPLFGHGEFKWRVRFTPNGQNDKTKGESTLGVKLEKLPDNINGVSIYFRLYLKETDTNWTYCSHFRDDYLNQSWQTCRIKFISLHKLKHFTIHVEISLIDIYYQ